MFSAVIELFYERSSSLPSNIHEDRLVLVALKLTGISSRSDLLGLGLNFSETNSCVKGM
uniref:Uncharacterized protein n=1 Tax=Arundo donax TaxID=35708 RepID=A0A0A9FAH4_ARUDO